MKERTERAGGDYTEVAPPGQDSCQPGPDMTSAEGEAGRHSMWLGGVRGWHQGGSLEGSLQHSRPCSALAHFVAVALCLLGRTKVSELH